MQGRPSRWSDCTQRTQSRRALSLVLLLVGGWLGASRSPANADDGAAWQALRSGAIVLFRHAQAPGVSDPPGFRLEDCTTQRNLDAEGRGQARRIGVRFAAEGIAVGAVLSSEWCRSLETAELAFPGRARREPAFNSFFDDRSQAGSLTRQALAILRGWRGEGALVVVSHNVNIAALTGVSPSSGEGIVVRVRKRAAPEVIGRIKP